MVNQFKNSMVSMELYNMENTKDITRFFSFKPYHSHVFLNLSCPMALQVISKASEKSYFNGSKNWILFGDKSINESVKLMAGQNINIDSKIFFVLAKINENGYAFEIYQITSASLLRGTPLNTKFIGKYDNPKHFILKSPKIDYNLQATYLIMGAMVRILLDRIN